MNFKNGNFLKKRYLHDVGMRKSAKTCIFFLPKFFREFKNGHVHFCFPRKSLEIKIARPYWLVTKSPKTQPKIPRLLPFMVTTQNAQKLRKNIFFCALHFLCILHHFYYCGFSHMRIYDTKIGKEKRSISRVH